ncbi:MAG: hypothetical protein ACEQSB_06980 [Undibacterium sp.]
MKTPKEYEIEIESLVAMNLKLQIQLTKALEAFVRTLETNNAAIKALNPQEKGNL